MKVSFHIPRLSSFLHFLAKNKQKQSQNFVSYLIKKTAEKETIKVL